jgi:UDP-2,3-diacylglucosamine pyrophosphatase LpxH
MGKHSSHDHSDISTELGRRTFLAGAGTAAVSATANAAVAFDDNGEPTGPDPDERVAQISDGPDLGELDHAIMVSDFQLGSLAANTDNFEDFLEQRLLGGRGNNPDALILAGDGVEMWFRGISSALLEFSNTIETFEEIHENGTEVIPIAGNHDWRFIDVDDQDPVISPEPWQFEEEVFFQSGGDEFVAIHGHQGEPIFSDEINEAFCLSTDEQGAQFSGDSDTDGSDAQSTEFHQFPDVSPEEVDMGNLDPDSDARETRRETITEAVDAMYDEYVLFGHTHIPEVADTYANSGSWTDRRAEEIESDTYLEIENGEVEVAEWP